MGLFTKKCPECGKPIEEKGLVVCRDCMNRYGKVLKQEEERKKKLPICPNCGSRVTGVICTCGRTLYHLLKSTCVCGYHFGFNEIYCPRCGSSRLD